MSSNASRRVARAAAAGRNARAKRDIPFGFYSVIVLLVILGILVVGYSRYERQHPAGTTGTPPLLNANWSAAIGFNDCGTYVANLPAQAAKSNGGIYTTGNGIVKISPTSTATTGSNATLAKFVSGIKGLSVTSDGFTLPGKTAVSAAKGCGGKAATFGIYSWPSLLASTPSKVSDPASLRFSNGQLIEIAVLPKGTSPSQPPSRVNLVTATTTTSSTTSSIPSSATTSTTTAPSSTATTSGSSLTSGSSTSTSTTKAAG